MRAVLYPEWLEENGQRKYPFADSASLTNGTDTIDNGLLLDAHLYPIGGEARQYLSRITIAADLITFAVSDQSGELCTGTVDPLAIARVIPMVDAYGRPAGTLLADEQQLSFLTSWNLGDHKFSSSTTALAATVVHPMPETGVRGFLVDGVLFAGDVWFVGGEGVVLTRPAEGVIRLDVPGDPYYTHTRCERINGEYTEPTRYLRTLSGLYPNKFGNIGIFPGANMAEDNTFRVVPLEGGIRIEFVGTRSSGGIYVRD